MRTGEEQGVGVDILEDWVTGSVGVGWWAVLCCWVEVVGIGG